jgi:hypothetical protein
VAATGHWDPKFSQAVLERDIGDAKILRRDPGERSVWDLRHLGVPGKVGDSSYAIILPEIMAITIPDAVRQMLVIVEQLCVAYPKKRFTLDGRLVGDIGEVLVEDAYDLELFPDVKKHHDAQCPDGRLVQIKGTMKKSLTFPADHVPDYYLGVQIHSDGTFSEIFNGPGEIAKQAIAGRVIPKTNLYSVGISALAKLQLAVPPTQQIPRREKRGATTLEGQ